MIVDVLHVVVVIRASHTHVCTRPEQFQQPVNGLSPSTGVWAVRMREGADAGTHTLCVWFREVSPQATPSQRICHLSHVDRRTHDRARKRYSRPHVCSELCRQKILAFLCHVHEEQR